MTAPTRSIPLHRSVVPLGVAGVLLTLAACGAEPVPHEVTTATTAGTRTTSPTSATDRPRPSGSPRPMGHIHGVGRDPETDDVVLATHGGLFRLDPSGPTPVGPVVDLMGFAVASDGSYLASGHPGAGAALDNPVGLIRSTDGGDTWTTLSRAGKSDFHGLTAGSGLVAGYDGALRVSTDGRSWQTRDIPSAPHVLAVSPDGGRLLATTPAGLLASTDGGETWTQTSTPELLVAVHWADVSTVVGVGTTGRLVASEDGGLTWASGGELGEVSTLHGYRDDDGALTVLAVVPDGVLSTSDLGRTVTRLL